MKTLVLEQDMLFTRKATIFSETGHIIITETVKNAFTGESATVTGIVTVDDIPKIYQYLQSSNPNLN